MAAKAATVTTWPPGCGFAFASMLRKNFKIKMITSPATRDFKGVSALFRESAETCRRRSAKLSGGLKGATEAVEARRSDVLEVFRKSLFEALLQTLKTPTSNSENDLVEAVKSQKSKNPKNSRRSLLRPHCRPSSLLTAPGAFYGTFVKMEKSKKFPEVAAGREEKGRRGQLFSA